MNIVWSLARRSSRAGAAGTGRTRDVGGGATVIDGLEGFVQEVGERFLRGPGRQ